MYIFLMYLWSWYVWAWFFIFSYNVTQLLVVSLHVSNSHFLNDQLQLEYKDSNLEHDFLLNLLDNWLKRQSTNNMINHSASEMKLNIADFTFNFDMWMKRLGCPSSYQFKTIILTEYRGYYSLTVLNIYT